jgi:hypothetical protein
MSWNRTTYDQCAYNKKLSQSTSPINYMMDTNKFYNSNDCRADFGILGGNNVSVTKKNMVDVENDLFGITRQNSLCPERKFIPHCEECSELSGIPCTNGGCKMAHLKHLPNCKMIDYSPRINHVGYNIKYPQSSTHGKQPKFPPQMNPTQRTVSSNL